MTITRQDLEDAARAAGVENWWPDSSAAARNKQFWNPDTNPADAWDLAMKCGMVIDFPSGTVFHQADPDIWNSKHFTPGNQQEAAEAVVLAAADIWRNRK